MTVLFWQFWQFLWQMWHPPTWTAWGTGGIKEKGDKLWQYDKLTMTNLTTMREWGHAKNYVEEKDSDHQLPIVTMEMTFWRLWRPPSWSARGTVPKPGLVQGDDEVVVMLKMSFIMNCLSILTTTMTNISGMWLMLQQDKPDDFVLATGHMHSVREFVEVVVNMNMNIITIIFIIVVI